jgi:hypothetical protein
MKPLNAIWHKGHWHPIVAGNEVVNYAKRDWPPTDPSKLAAMYAPPSTFKKKGK